MNYPLVGADPSSWSPFGNGYHASNIFARGASNIFGGGLPPAHTIIKGKELRHMLHMYKHHNRIKGSGLPFDHIVHLLKEGEKGRGGFLPFAALLPMLGSALSTLGPALLTGAAGAAASSGVKRLLGDGAVGLPYIHHDKSRDEYILHGEGWKDVFKTVLGHAGKLLKRIISSDKVRGIARSAAESGKEALMKAAGDFLSGRIERHLANKTTPAEAVTPREDEPTEDNPNDDLEDIADDETTPYGQGYRRRRFRYKRPSTVKRRGGNFTMDPYFTKRLRHSYV